MPATRGRTLHANVLPRRAISPQIGTDNTALVSQIIDVRGYGSLEFVIATGTLADVDATFAVLVEHGDDSGLSDAAAVPDANLRGTEAAAGFVFSDDDAVKSIGYDCSKRYCRLTLTPTGNSGNAAIAAIALLGAAHQAPVV